MSGVTTFMNDALGQIGATRINSIDDESANANWCLDFWDKLRQALLREHYWNFAETRTELNQDTVPPLFEYTFSYSMPVDLLRLKVYNGINLPMNIMTPTPDAIDDFSFVVAGMFKVEGRKIFCNDDPVKIVYIRDIPNPDLWDSLFYQYAAGMMAGKLCGAISRDQKRAESIMQHAITFWKPLALASDGQEQVDLPIQSDSLIWGR